MDTYLYFLIIGALLLFIWLGQLLVQIGNTIALTILQVWKAENQPGPTISKIEVKPSKESRVLMHLLFWLGLAAVIIGLVLA